MATTNNVELQVKYDKEIYRTDIHPLWCPGCGDFAILKAIKNAMYELQLDPSQTILVPGIGCSSKMMSAVGVYGFHTIHGRALPAATGIKIANHKLNVIAFGGDGDMVGIGSGHFLHAARRNLNMTVIISNNQIYGLTTGQASPTSDQGFKTRTTPTGVVDKPLNPSLLAISAGATFVARSSTARNDHLQKMIEAAVEHKGMSVIEVMQFCITFNKVNTPDYYEPRYFDVQETSHDLNDFGESLKLASMWGDKIPIGIMYRDDHGSFEDSYKQLQGNSLVEKRPLTPRDVTKIFNKSK